MRNGVRNSLAGMIGAALLAAAGSSPADAQTGWYVGFGAGQADNRQFDDKDHGYKLFGGYAFTPNFSVELSYIDLGRYPLPGLPTAREYDHYGVAAQLLGRLPLGDSGLSLFGKAGLFSWYGYSNRYDIYYYYYESARDTGTDLAVGAGLQLDLQRHWAVRAEWERFYDVAGGDINLVSASVFYRF